MNINKVSSLVTADMGTTKSKPNQSDQQAVSDLPTTAKQNNNPVSEDWQLIEQAQVELAKIDDFDAEKVAKLRQSLVDGTFELDAAKISQAMKQHHGQ